MKTKIKIMSALIYAMLHLSFIQKVMFGGLMGCSFTNEAQVNSYAAGGNTVDISFFIKRLPSNDTAIKVTDGKVSLKRTRVVFDNMPSQNYSISPIGKIMWIDTQGEMKVSKMDSVVKMMNNNITVTYSNVVGIPTNLSQFTNGPGYLVAEVDGSVSNEIQTLSGTGTQTITLSSGGTFVIPTQTTALTLAQVTTALVYIPLAVEVDGSITNEIQTLSGSGTQTLSLSNGGGSFVIATQTTALTSSQVTTALGATPLFAEVDGSTSNELQTISGTGTNTITLSNSGGTWSPPARTTNTVSRSLMTTTTNVSFSVSATQDYNVVYSVYSQITSALGGTNTAEVYLERSADNSVWVTIAGGPAVLAGGVLSTAGGVACLSGFIPASYWVRIRVTALGSNSGSAVFIYKFGVENSY